MTEKPAAAPTQQGALTDQDVAMTIGAMSLENMALRKRVQFLEGELKKIADKIAEKAAG